MSKSDGGGISWFWWIFWGWLLFGPGGDDEKQEEPAVAVEVVIESVAKEDPNDRFKKWDDPEPEEKDPNDRFSDW